MQENLEVSTGKLLIQHRGNEFSLVRLFTSEPTPLEEKNLGRIFILTEIEASDDIYEELIELINDEFNHHYYRSEDFDTELALEQSLQKLNKKLQEAIAEIGKEWLHKLNIVIAVLKGDEMHFTQLGTAQAFLIQNDQIINVIDSAKAKTQQVNALKIFSNVLSGKLNQNSALVFCTESLLDYLSPEKIKKTVLENTPKKAADHLEKILSEDGTQTNFTALIMKMQLAYKKSPAKKQISIEQAEEEDDDSMDELITKEKTTTELLKPSVWSSVKGSIGSWKGEKEKTPPNSETKNDFTQDLPEQKKEGSQKALSITKKILAFFKHVGLQIVAAILFVFKKIFGMVRQPKEYRNKFDSLPGKTTGKVSQIVNWFKKLSLPRKILLVLVIVAIFVFAQTVVYKGKSQETAEEKTQYEQNLTDAENQINEAKADLLMNNEAGAREKLDQANNLLTPIPDKKDYEERKSTLLASMQEQYDKINHVEQLYEPRQVADFTQINASLSIGEIALIGDNIYGFDQNNLSVYQSGLESQEAKVVISDETKQITALTKDSAATVLAMLDDQSFVQFNPVLEKYSDVSIDLPSKETTFQDLVVYGPRLYILETKIGQIFKHTKSGDDYGAPERWLDDNVSVNNALSIAIDGSVYVLKPDGKLLKLYAGVKEEDFNLEEFSPAITQATQVYTNENTQNIYLLDPGEKRLVVYDKQGKLAKQYTSGMFDNLLAMEIDEINKKAYLLNNAQVYQVDL